MSKPTISKEIKAIGEVYLRHEFRKIFNDIKDEKFWVEINKSMGTFLKREGDESFWNLLFGISEGWKIKYVAHILSDTRYKWKLQNFSIDKITLSGMSPVIDKYTIIKCDKNPLIFSKTWDKNGKMRKEIKDSGFSEHKERDSDPIFLYQKNGKFYVFDGMRRTLLAAIRKDKIIKAWVGYEKNPKGKPMISVSRCLFLADMLKLYPEDKKLKTSIIKVVKKISEEFNNGRKVFIGRIANWSHDDNIKKTLKETIGGKK